MTIQYTIESMPVSRETDAYDFSDQVSINITDISTIYIDDDGVTVDTECIDKVTIERVLFKKTGANRYIVQAYVGDVRVVRYSIQSDSVHVAYHHGWINIDRGMHP